MKKMLVLILLVLGSVFCKADDSFCGPMYMPDAEYYNLFMQETINDPQYYPFLRSEGSSFYESGESKQTKNENIEEWQDYLDLSYSQAYFLVFEATQSEVRALIKGKGVSTEKLGFATPTFVKRHKQALLYLAYAKYLAPYMRVKNESGSNSWNNQTKHSVAELNYDKVIKVLRQSWKAETSKELKLRYGYQLVRFAHYNRKYQTALDFFDQYVEPLNYKPIMYYYALDQKGGAEHGLGNYMQANADFFQFFIHTKNRKENAYKSMNLLNNVDLQHLLRNAKTDKAKNDIYLLLGFNDFNNPLSSFSKIIKTTPDAVQAKVLMARAINQLERNYFPLTYYCPYTDTNCFERLDNRKLPITTSDDAQDFLNQTMIASLQQVKNPKVKDKTFWNLTTAYLYFIQKKYDKAQNYLNRVNVTNKIYKEQKNKLAMLIAITDRNKITPDFEQILLKKYGKYMKAYQIPPSRYANENGTLDFIVDILANRYFLQGDYGKAFLLQNNITSLESNPDMQILSQIVKLHNKPHKNAFEKHMVKNIAPRVYNYKTQKTIRVKDFNFDQYVAQMKGNIYLSQGKLEKAKVAFDKVSDDFEFLRYRYVYNMGTVKRRKFDTDEYNGYSNIPNLVFGTNRIVCFSCDDIVETHYLKNFAFIKTKMNKRQLTDALIKLDEIAQRKTEMSAKADYLLGNFFFNTTTIGFYRQLLTFDLTNDNGRKFHNYNGWNHPSPDYSDRLYFKNYTDAPGYVDDFQIPLSYLKKGLAVTKNKELKAQLLFAAAKCEQGVFYQKGEKEFSDQYQEDKYNQEYEQNLMNYKVAKYRPYFKQLKENYNHTDYYDSLRRNCKYFNYYIINY